MVKRPMLLVLSNMILCSMMSILFSSMLAENAFAYVMATPVADPLVMIAIDTTNLQPKPCMITVQPNISNVPVAKIPCPIGTLIESTIVHRSQAIAQHESYINLPSPSASPSLLQRLQQKIVQMMETKAHLLHHLSKISIFASIPCGSGGTMKVDPWYGFNGSTKFASYESYLKTADCKSVYLQVATVHEYAGNSTVWDHDQYQGGYFETSHPGLVPGDTYNHIVDEWWDAGYYYETWLWQYYDGYIHNAYPNIGPL